MARFCVFASSSKGNSSYLSCGGASILIDAGISCRRICSGIAAVGDDYRDLDAILITHEHSDHINGLLNLVKKTGAQVFATAPVLEYIISHGHLPADAAVNEITDSPFEIKGVEVNAFATPHDSIDSVGYRFSLSNGEEVAVATDLGHITDEVRAGVLGCQTVLLESNYDAQLLKMGHYPWFLKQRINSENGHLENTVSAQFAAELVKTGTTRLFLGHLSRENNTPSLARQAAELTLCQCGAVSGVDFQLEVAPYDELSKIARF